MGPTKLSNLPCWVRPSPGQDLDLVTFFNCLHDMGDLVGAARRVRQMPKPSGSWMIVEPAASDRLEDNLNPSAGYTMRLS